MNVLSQLLFGIKLFLSLTATLWQFAWHTKPPLTSLGLTMLFVMWMGGLMATTLSPTSGLFKNTPSPAALKELNQWRELYRQQPTHRDVLITIALLEKSIGNQDGYVFWWDKAVGTDPNYEGFKTQ